MSSASGVPPPVDQTGYLTGPPSWPDAFTALSYVKMMGSPMPMYYPIVNQHTEVKTGTTSTKLELPPTVSPPKLMVRPALPILEVVELMERYNQLTFQEIRLVQSLRYAFW